MENEEKKMTRLENQVKLFEGLVVRILSNHNTLNCLLESEDRTSILTKIAPGFFNMLNDLLIRDFFLESAKILESSRSRVKGGVRENLTIRFFVEQMGWNQKQQKIMNEFNEKLQEFYPWIKDARDRIIGHNDLLTYEDEQSDGLGAFDIGLDVEFVKLLEAFYNYLHEITFGEIWGSFAPNVESGSP